uniref:Uncharacterized protein n=1 Tax=Oryza barthii TaxID=65489 RepID=A0A0D3FUN8_9ORYZ
MASDGNGNRINGGSTAEELRKGGSASSGLGSGGSTLVRHRERRWKGGAAITAMVAAGSQDTVAAPNNCVRPRALDVCSSCLRKQVGRMQRSFL